MAVDPSYRVDDACAKFRIVSCGGLEFRRQQEEERP